MKKNTFLTSNKHGFFKRHGLRRLCHGLLTATLLFCGTALSAPLNISQTPLFLSEEAEPLLMLVIGRDHKLFFEAYNDSTDIDGDGVIDTRFKPEIDYFGYFDSYKCYNYQLGVTFFPASVTPDKRCNGNWSGNFLNYLATSRLDALRKVLYGGWRVADRENATVLRAAHIPRDGHTWGKEYTSPQVDGYNISNYTPYAPPANGLRHLFAIAPLGRGPDIPNLKVSLNQPYRIWEWVSKERPVAGNTVSNGANIIINDFFNLQVLVCDPGVGLEDNCRTYPNGSIKPIGLLQEFGENDAMFFGLITGSYNNNLRGGVLRKNISSFTDEVDLNTGLFTNVNGIVSTLNQIAITGFNANFEYNCGWINNRNLNNGECNSWGNPIAEMMYEAVRYFSGKGEPTAVFNTAGGLDAALNLPFPDWQDPYVEFPRCAKPNMLVISDVYPSYDSDQVPGQFPFSGINFGGDLDPALNASALAQQIYAAEGFGLLQAFIGQSGGISDGAPTPKPVNSFGSIRGLAPHEANSEGSYYAASVAYYGWQNDVHAADGEQNIKSFIVGLSSPAPEMTFNVGGNPVTIIPFGKSVAIENSNAINPAEGEYQPTNNIVDFYIESLTPNSAIFRVNFEDIQQGGDFDMDAIVRYEVTVNDNNSITISLNSVYAGGNYIQHMGYIISGTTQDGVYLEVRDADTAVIDDIDYFLDTPPNQLPGQGWADGQILPLQAVRTFWPSNNPAATTFRSPLYYAAKWGGFNDVNDNGMPDQTEEWDTDLNGQPDNYFLVTNANNLKDQLATAFESISERTGSFSSASLSSGFLNAGSRIYQAIFKTKDWGGQLLAFAIDENTGDILTNGTGPGGSIWDGAQKLALQNFDNGRHIITYKPSSGTGIPFRWPDNPAAPGISEIDPAQISALNENPITGLQDGAGEKRLEYLRGDQSSEAQNGGTFRDRSSLLGDIINSNPVIIGTPSQPYPAFWPAGSPENNFPYTIFRLISSARPSVLYVGSNDGMLHAFNADTGEELLAYVPSAVYDHLSNLTNPEYSHRYFVDGSPTVIDAFFSGIWHTMLVGGLNGGGQGIYALDVTDPFQFTENNAGNLVQWEFNDSDDADLGFTYSQPAVVRLANGQWGAIFGNGYNNTVSDDNQSATGNAVIYIVNIQTGALIRKFDTGVGMADDPLGLARPNGMASPAVLDADGNYIADYIYAGDLFGNLWKINISSTNPADWDFSFQNGIEPAPFYIARDSNGDRQPITIKPSISRLNADPAGFQIYIGTGQYLELTDKTNLQVQTVYGLRDTNATPIAGRAELQAQSILSEDGGFRVVSNNLLANNIRGWYLDLIVDGNARGERVVSNMLYLNQKIIFSTLIPSEDICTFGGEGWLMELNAFTGTRLDYNVFDVNGDGAFDSGDFVIHSTGGGDISVPASGVLSSVGLINTPAVLNAGNIEYKYLSGTSGSMQKITENPGAGQYGRQSWRQMQ